MFTETTFNNPNWLQQKDHESSINTRLVLVNFSFASRSSLVRYSLVYRRPIENRTRIYLRTKDEREVIEDTTKKKSNLTRMADFNFRTLSGYAKQIQNAPVMHLITC